MIKSRIGLLLVLFVFNSTPFLLASDTTDNDFYMEALDIIDGYAWIPGIDQKTYRVYNAQRKQNISPKDVYIDYLIEPVKAVLKTRIINEKYPRGNISDPLTGKLLPEWDKKVEKETDRLIIAILEKNYQENILPKLIEKTIGDF